ncbi:MAG TPA: glycosyltransferase family 39 protein [Anaerolineales bacterium]|nr:glycosyltransferase family 39 protein [Anaerolineales bacterium]
MPKTRSWFFLLCGLEGALASTALLLIPSESGLSLARLALLILLFTFCLMGIYFGLRPPRRLSQFARPIFIIGFALLSLTFGLLLFLLRYLDPERLLSYYLRLSPLLWYLLIISLQATFYLLYLKNGLNISVLHASKPLFPIALIFLILLLSILVLISITRLGLTPDPAYWAEPGVPIQAWHFVLALVAGSFIPIILHKVRSFDLLIPVFVYVLACALWMSVPLDVLKNSFYVTLDPPTFQPFPYSDAAYYDSMAHSLLIGHPYFGDIPTRPLYIVFLSLLHLLFGENYPHIIAAQTFVLAFIPVLFYFLGKKLHSRIAGLVIALFFIFRELTTLLLSSDTRVSNTKTLMTDLPTLLFLLLACLFFLRWLERRDHESAFLAGGVFACLLLLRTQSLLILPVVLFLSLLAFGRQRLKRWWLTAAFFMLALFITVAPWLAHNYWLTGEITFDASLQYKTLASQYAYSGNLDIGNYDFQGKSLFRVLLDFTLKDPGFVFGFIANHFLASQINALLALPLLAPFNGIFAPIPLYWMTWDGSLEWYNRVLVFLYLTVISLGLGAAWKRWRWIGLTPFVFSWGYSLGTAVGRFSGWRYDLPADWVAYFYFGIGFAEIVRNAILIFNGNDEAPLTSTTYISEKRPHALARMGLFALAFIWVGAFPWLAKELTSPRYTDQMPSTLEAKIASLHGAPALAEIQSFSKQPNTFLEVGRILYPRFFRRNQGIASANPWPSYQVRDYPRMGFLLIHQHLIHAVFPAKEPPQPFPHAADAILLGCAREEYVEVRLIAFPELDVVHLSAPLTEPCTP